MADPDHGGEAAKRAILSGDLDGLRAFYDGHFRPLYAFCFFRVGRDHPTAEEVVQDTLCLALERIADYDPARGDLHTWLAYLARNRIRRANEARRRSLPLEAEPAAPGGDGAGERAEIVGVALGRLPARYRSILERKYLEGRSVREIAGIEATSEKAVESLLSRARDAFRTAFLRVEEQEVGE